MKGDHSHAENILSRVFSYTPRSDQRTPLEDFCTESLAWCLINSDGFADKFIEKIKAKLATNAKLGPIFRKNTNKIHVDTQISFKESDDGLEAATEGAVRFDLIIKSRVDDSFLVIIEVKTGFDRGLTNQLGVYRGVISTKRPWRTYKEKYIVSLTPSSRSNESADAHISWAEVHSLLATLPTATLIHKQFSEFLNSRHLGNIKLMKPTPSLISSFREMAHYTTGFNVIFERFTDHDNLKRIFSNRQTSRRVLEYADEYEGRWYNKVPFYYIHNDSGSPGYYAGICEAKGKLWLYMQVDMSGDTTAKIKKIEDDAAVQAMTQANNLFNVNPVYYKDQGCTTFIFLKELTAQVEAEDILPWFETVAQQIIKALDQNFSRGFDKG